MGRNASNNCIIDNKGNSAQEDTIGIGKIMNNGAPDGTVPVPIISKPEIQAAHQPQKDWTPSPQSQTLPQTVQRQQKDINPTPMPTNVDEAEEEGVNGVEKEEAVAEGGEMTFESERRVSHAKPPREYAVRRAMKDAMSDMTRTVTCGVTRLLSPRANLKAADSPLAAGGLRGIMRDDTDKGDADDTGSEECTWMWGNTSQTKQQALKEGQASAQERKCTKVADNGLQHEREPEGDDSGPKRSLRFPAIPWLVRRTPRTPKGKENRQRNGVTIASGIAIASAKAEASQSTGPKTMSGENAAASEKLTTETVSETVTETEIDTATGMSSGGEAVSQTTYGTALTHSVGGERSPVRITEAIDGSPSRGWSSGKGTFQGKMRRVLRLSRREQEAEKA